MAFQRRRSFPTRQRNATDWGRTLIANTTIGGSTKVLLGSFILANPGIGEVIRRTRGRFHVISDQGSVTEQQDGALGMIVVTDTALAVGITAIPGPVTDANDDGWFVWEPFTQVSQLTLGASFTSGGTTLQYEFDSKAMRKVAHGFSMAIVLESNVSGCEFGVGMSLLTSRM